MDVSSAAYPGLASRLGELEKRFGLPGNRAFYLALPPALFPEAIKGIGESGLNRAEGWVRLVVEKPFGRDLATAKDLNRLVLGYFDEFQIFRIDHYLGKETVQNLLKQLLTLVAMEAPPIFDPESIRNEKLKVLQSISPLEIDAVVFAQYSGGEIDGKPVLGYMEEAGIAPDSVIETYQTLLRDILTGGQNLFVRSDEVEYSWGLFTTLIEKRPLVSSYPAGSWGPEEADALLARDGHRWLNM